MLVQNISLTDICIFKDDFRYRKFKEMLIQITKSGNSDPVLTRSKEIKRYELVMLFECPYRLSLQTKNVIFQFLYWIF